MSEFNDGQINVLAPIVNTYTADFCDPRSKIQFLDRIKDKGFVELSARLALEHYEKCAKDARFLELASYNYSDLGNYQKALELSDQLVQYDPASPNYRFERGKSYEGMQRFDKALIDYITTLGLFKKIENVAAVQFYEIASMYAALNRFCEAATPLETYLSFDYPKRKSQQIDNLIAEYRNKGNCQLAKNAPAVLRAKRKGMVLLVQVSINNVPGIFILDTGASMVTVTKSFAVKSHIAVNPENEISFQTANGLTKGILATADSVQAGNAFSTRIPISVMEDHQLGSADDVVGLLGMSFLSKFDYAVRGETIELNNRF